MFLWEILEPDRVLTATARFRDSFNKYKQQYPVIVDRLNAFVEFRLTHRPDEPYVVKDSPFSVHNALRGFRHFHMVHGTVILIYQITPAELRLCLVTDHSYDSKIGNNKLINFLHSANMTFDRFDTEPELTLSDSQIADINGLLYEFAAADRTGLIRTLTNVADLMDFIHLMIEGPWTDEQKDEATFAAFGGRDGLIKAVQKVLAQTAATV
jgi:mRNA-degrading endonuclease YafQ of YafQ-DinJ toxin-antitoxin module